MSHKIENKRVRVEVGEDDFTTVQVNDNNVAIIVNPNDKDWIYGEYMRIRRKRVRAVTNVSQQGGSGGGGSEPEVPVLYPGVDLMIGLLPDDDIRTIMYNASWTPNYRVWVLDRNSESPRIVTGLYEGSSLSSLAKTGVAFDNTDNYCACGSVIEDTINGSRFLLFYYGPNGSVGETVGVAVSNDEGLSFGTDLGVILQSGVGPVPSDINRIFPLDCKIVGSTYYLVCREAHSDDTISRIVLYSTTNQNMTGWTRVLVIFSDSENTSDWDSRNVSQMTLRFDVDSDRWIGYYAGGNEDDTIRQIGVAYASTAGLSGIESEFIRHSSNPILTEVQTLNGSENRQSFIGIPVVFEDVSQTRYIYRGFFKDFVNNDLDWRAIEALTTNPGTTWYKPFRDLKQGSWDIDEVTNQSYRFEVGGSTAFANCLMENITSFLAVRLQIDPVDKSNSALCRLGVYTSFAAPTSNTNLYAMTILNSSPYNTVRITENGAVTDVVVGGDGIAAGDFLRIQIDGDNLLYYINETLLHTGVATPSTLYPVVLNSGSSLNKFCWNFRILVNRIG